MPERRYTLKEIDQMREFLLARSRPDFSRIGVGPDGMEPKGKAIWTAWRADVEQELRTCLLAGTDPADFQLKD